jgi:hypothetical protein
MDTFAHVHNKLKESSAEDAKAAAPVSSERIGIYSRGFHQSAGNHYHILSHVLNIGIFQATPQKRKNGVRLTGCDWDVRIRARDHQTSDKCHHFEASNTAKHLRLLSDVGMTG